jgi:glutamate carboxypeptidase
VRSAADGYPCQVKIDVTRRTAPWSRNETTDRLLAVWQEAGESLGYQVRAEERGGLSDGNHFWQAVPTLDGLGVAGGNAHCSERSPDGSKDQEYCEAGSFVPKAVLNVTAVLKLLSRVVNE